VTGTQRHRRHRPGHDFGPVAVLEGLQTQFALRCLGITCGKFATILADPPWRFSHRFTYKSNLVWYKIRKDGGPDGRGMGFYFRNVTELVLFGTRGSIRTDDAGRRAEALGLGVVTEATRSLWFHDLIQLVFRRGNRFRKPSF